jgi:AcrR family transcriptional regulator
MNKSTDKPKKKLTLWDKKKEKARNEILNVSYKFLLDNPFSDISVEDIAKEAVISRTTIYKYFCCKDEILFGLGIKLFTEENDFNEKNFPEGMTGYEQVLYLSERFFKVFSDMVGITIVREFFTRINFREVVPVEEMHNEIVESFGTSKYDELLNRFDDSFLIEFYIQMLRINDLWIRAVSQGKKDKTIIIDMTDEQIVHFLHLVISGVMNEIHFRKSSLKRIQLDYATITQHSLALIACFLQKNEKY